MLGGEGWGGYNGGLTSCTGYVNGERGLLPVGRTECQKRLLGSGPSGAALRGCTLGTVHVKCPSAFPSRCLA